MADIIIGTASITFVVTIMLMYVIQCFICLYRQSLEKHELEEKEKERLKEIELSNKISRAVSIEIARLGFLKKDNKELNND